MRTLFHLFLISCLHSIVIMQLHAQSADDIAINAPKKTDSIKPTVMIAEVTLGKEMPLQLIAKSDAAMAIALGAADRFRYIPFADRDSVAAIFKSLQAEPTAFNVGQEIKAEVLLFLRIDQLGNLLRVEIQAKAGNQYTQSVTGIGLGLLRYRDTSNAIIYEPTLIEAMQRAMCGITGDSNLYAHVEDSSYMVFPAEPLTFLSMELDNAKQKSLWAIFQNNEVNSYYGLQVLFEAASNLKHVIPIDLDTRDSVYALKQVYGVENHIRPTQTELKILYDVGLTYGITGLVEKTQDGAELTLTLQEITQKGGLKRIRSLTAGFSEDSLEGFKKTAMKLLRRLLR